MGRILATADIGSNTVHLLVAEVTGADRLRRLLNSSEWLSLGESVARIGEIPEAKIVQLIELLRFYKGEAKQSNAEAIYVFATEAMRAARNGTEVLNRLQRDADVRVEIITPQTEAEFSLQGARIDAPSKIGLLLEIGGGSAQVAICGDGDKLIQEHSLPIGTGRLIAEAEIVQPATPRCLEALSGAVNDAISRLPSQPEIEGLAVASGGVGRGLLRALHRDGDQVLDIKEIEFLAWSCARLTIDQIIDRFAVKPKRAAALLPGATAFAALMRRFGVSQIFVSEYGVREGAIMQVANGSVPAWLA